MTRRVLTATLLSALVIMALYRFCWEPWRCNRVTLTATRDSNVAFENRGTPAGRALAATSTGLLLPCTRFPCRTTNVEMLLAANERVLEQPSRAAAHYHQALSADRRPEILAGLATAELEMGDHAGAVRDYVHACLANPWTLRTIEDGLVRVEVQNALIARRPENADFIRYIGTLRSTD